MLVRCWGRGSILYSQIRLRFFSEVTTPLDCGLYMYFLVLPPHSSLSGTRWLEWAGVGYFSSPSECQSQLELTISLLLGQLNSDKTPADLALVNQFLQRAHFIRMNGMLWDISKWFFSSPPMGNMRGFSLAITLRTCQSSRRQNSQSCWNSPLLDPSGVFISQACPH